METFLTIAAVALGFGVLAIIASILSRKSMEKSVAMSQSLADFALARFDDLDVDGDGMITHTDIDVILYGELAASFSPAELVLLKRLRFDLCYAGHLISSHPSISPMSGAVVVLEWHGANRDDLASYTERIQRKYAERYSKS